MPGRTTRLMFPTFPAALHRALPSRKSSARSARHSSPTLKACAKMAPPCPRHRVQFGTLTYRPDFALERTLQCVVTSSVRVARRAARPRRRPTRTRRRIVRAWAGSSWRLIHRCRETRQCSPKCSSPCLPMRIGQRVNASCVVGISLLQTLSRRRSLLLKISTSARTKSRAHS